MKFAETYGRVASNCRRKRLIAYMWSTRHHEYKFSEVTRSNVQQYIDLIRLYFSFSRVEFHSLMVNRLAEGFDFEAVGERRILDRLYTEFTSAIAGKESDAGCVRNRGLAVKSPKNGT